MQNLVTGEHNTQLYIIIIRLKLNFYYNAQDKKKKHFYE